MSPQPSHLCLARDARRARKRNNHATGLAAVLNKMAKNQGRQLMRQQNIAVLVHHARTVPITIEEKPYVLRLLRRLSPRTHPPGVARLGMEPAEVLACVGVNLPSRCSPDARAQGKHASAGTIHGVDHNIETCRRNGRAIDQRN